MKDLLDAINTRVKEPYWGFFLLSFLAFNWRGLFLLFFATGTAQERIVLFDSQTNFWGLLFLPIVTSVVILLTTPWLKVIFGYATRSAYERINSQELKRENKYLSEKNLLEKERAVEFANKENELIDQAKRDVDIDQIADEETRNKLKMEIDKLRHERNQLVHPIENKNLQELSDYELDLLYRLNTSQDHCVQKKKINGHDFLVINNANIHERNNSPLYYRTMDAITSLTRKGLLKDLNSEGKLFEMTSDAKKIASKLDL